MKPNSLDVFKLDASRIIYQDDDLLVVNKPPRLPSHSTLDPKRPHLVRAVQGWLQAQSPNEPVYVGQHQRLDVDTSGAIAFTLSRRANRGLAEQFSAHVARKTYWAIVQETKKSAEVDEWIVKNHLGPIAKSKPTKMTSVTSGGDSAETEFSILARGVARSRRFALVEARPLTGRMHQIRVHLAESLKPIIGDPLYAPEAAAFAPRLMLHARRLEIAHPVTGEAMRFEAELPEDFLATLRELGMSQAALET